MSADRGMRSVGQAEADELRHSGRSTRPGRKNPSKQRRGGRGRGVVLPQLLVSAVESCGDAVAV
ncbi:hypothetical protein, partial [Rhodococcus sp. HNM0563]|uniref:hypothetical protein n=1 Tax=Rhodococcus sp. HNM0563 TaxID=2716339 RepID=UPI0019804ED5